MIALDEDALICDFAETYHIYDMKQYDPAYIGTLSVGLRDNSRIKMLMADRRASVETVLLAGIVDRLSIIISGDKAKLIAKNFVKEEQQQSYGFETSEEFDAAWAALGAENGERN